MYDTRTQKEIYFEAKVRSQNHGEVESVRKIVTMVCGLSVCCIIEGHA